jgi:hypothetical protein
MLLGCGVLWQLQLREPERFNVNAIANLGERMGVMLIGLVVLGTIWLIFDSWEQQIVKKTKPRLVELTRIDRFYGGVVCVRKLPVRVWNEAVEGDRLIKHPWTIYAMLEHRQRHEAVPPPPERVPTPESRTTRT